LSLIQRWFAAHWKLLIIPLAGVAAGLAIALQPNAHRTAGSIAAQPDRAKYHVSGEVAHTTANARPTSPITAACQVTYSPTSWPGQFLAQVTIDNRGAKSINGWKLTFTFPGDEAISSAWNATFTQTGARVSATNTTYDAPIPPGGSQSLGFLGTWASNDAAPTSFSVNARTCS
jgi:hypothetical protein